MAYQDESSPSPTTRVKLVASTGDITAGHATAARDSRGDGDISGYFESAQWTADGTTLLTSSSSNEVSGYIVPADLLSPRRAPHALTPSARIPLAEPSSVLAGAPYFDLSSPWTNQVLVSARDHPLQLFYLDPSGSAPASSYPLTKNARSETFLAATSLAWAAPGTHFVAGARSLLARYDVSRAGDGPLSRIHTIPSERHLAKGGGVGMRGAVSALGHGHGDRLIAAGTWTRWVGLYDFGSGGGECVATWSIASAAAGTAIAGDGVTQTLWSPCGRYLVVAERKARGALVYDVRVTGRLLGWLAGREATGNQRIGCDVFPGQDGGDGAGGFEVWSGSAGGAVKVWEGVGGREGAHEPAWGWRAHGRSAVGSACVHASGSVVATCAGSWEFPDDEEEGGGGEAEMGDGHLEGRMAWMRRRNKESSLKIWSIGDGQGGKDDDEKRGVEEEEAEEGEEEAKTE
ncbi:hypothetical protein F4775DRAFT_603046 [Biscogniauxia sp. FL1348]|nr:hypothetical protein F4775DRAFT_603046 [Biscogniauxia sp. FL1348]